MYLVHAYECIQNKDELNTENRSSNNYDYIEMISFKKGGMNQAKLKIGTYLHFQNHQHYV